MGNLSEGLALNLSAEMLKVAAIVSAPLIGITCLAGLLVSLLQAVTQVQESSLSFIPKLIAAVAVLLTLGGWMMSRIVQFATQVIGSIPQYF